MGFNDNSIKFIASFLFLLGAILIFRQNALQLDPTRSLAGFGMSAVVLPNPQSVLNQQLIAKERELDARELALNQRQLNISSTTSMSAETRSFLAGIVVAAAFLLLVNVIRNRNRT